MQPTRKDSTQKEAYLLDRKLHSVKLDFKNVKLHGRDKEIKTLREVYNRALLRNNPNSKEPKEVVFVYGYSGVGKSALVETLRDVGAIMVAGKFDQKIRSEPFSAIVEALSELCDYILAYDSNKLSDLRVKLKEKFSKKEGELKAVCNLVPKISEVVGLGEEETRKRDQGKSEGTRSGAFTKMKEGCLLFLQVVCMSSLGAMITLFIDDLQWGDVASIDLIKDIATDDDNNSLLFVGAYRDNEVDDVHPLAVQLRQLEAMGSITNVQLYIGELDLVSVNKIIADAMHSTSMEPLKELANIVYKKTEGNAFFLIQFLRGLQKDGLVYYSMEKFSWKWDAATIEAETAVSENIVDFMAGKIRQLPQDLTEAMKIGSCLGRRFEARLVAKVMNLMVSLDKEMHTADVVSMMDIAIAEGIINAPMHPGRFLFAHDRIQQAAYSLFLPDVAKRNASHLCIGRILKKQLESAQGDHHNEWLALAAAEQLNLGVDQITSKGERIKLAHLNCRAAELASEKSAFFPSKTYLEAGLELLDNEHKWNQNYELTLKMTTMLARMQYATGSTNECKKSVGEVLRHARTMREKMHVYIIEIEALGSEGNATEAIALALDVLKQLGEPFPRNPRRFHIFLDMRTVQKLMKDRTNEELLAAPEVADENKRAAMDVLRLLSTLAIVSSQGRFLVLLQARQMKLALLHGVSKCTPTACASWGYFQANEGKWEDGSRLGKLSLKFLDRFESEKEIHAEALKLNHVYLNHLKHPIHDSLDPMFRAYQLGMQTGDIKNAAFAANLYLDMYFWCGLPLTPILQDAKSIRDEMTRYKQDVARDFVAIKYQCILNLMDRSRDPLNLVGSGMDEEELMKSALESKTFWVAQHIRLMRVVVAYHLGEISLAWERAEEFIDNDTDSWGVEYMTGPNCFILSMAALGVLKIKRSRRIQRKSRKYIKKVAEWDSKGEVNAKHLHLILLAEKAALAKVKYDDGKEAYDKAITSASRGGFLQNAALACERAAEYLASRGEEERGEDYLLRSFQFYQEWGAVSKLKQLRSKYSMFNSHVVEERRGTNRFGCERYTGEVEELHHRRSGDHSELLSVDDLDTSLPSEKFEEQADDQKSSEILTK